jgi:hypothetical protein
MGVGSISSNEDTAYAELPSHTDLRLHHQSHQHSSLGVAKTDLMGCKVVQARNLDILSACGLPDEALEPFWILD